MTGMSREHKKKKNAGESERMKTRNEAKKKKVLKSTKLGPKKKSRQFVRSKRKITSVTAFVYWLPQYLTYIYLYLTYNLYLTEKVSKRSMCHNRKQLPGETRRTGWQQREGKRPSSCLVSKALFTFKDHYSFKMFEQI